MSNLFPKARTLIFSTLTAATLFGALAQANAPLEPSILGGKKVPASSPFASSAVFIYDMKRSALCSGTLIAPHFVLTAAHCTNQDPTQLMVVFSNQLPTVEKPMDPSLVRRVFAGRTTSGWSQVTPQTPNNWGDLAVIRYDGDTPAEARPATLLPSTAGLIPGAPLLLAGYGITNGLQPKDPTGLRDVTVPLAEIVSPTEFAINQSAGKGICHGDSGGPAYLKTTTGWAVAGVTSRSNPGCTEVAIFTEVTPYLSWIQGTMKALATMKKPEKIPQPSFNSDSAQE